MNTLRKILPILEWLPRYKPHYLGGDLFAGLTVGVMLIPQGMAYALIAGLPPVYGLYAAIVPQMVYALFGTSRQLSVAPVAMDSLLVATGVSVMAAEGTEAYISFAIMLAAFMGVFQVLLGIFRMGFVTNLLSRPVISGFTSAAAFIIGLNQLQYLLGIPLEKTHQVHLILWEAVHHISQAHGLTLLLGIAGIVVILLAKRRHVSLPGALIAVILGAALVYALELHEAGVRIVGTIPQGLPSFQLPAFSPDHIGRLAPLAATISLVAYVEAFSVAKSLEAKSSGHKVRPNQELVALGAANFAGSFFQAFPVTGGFSRSAVNHQSGARTPLASVVSALVVGLTLVFFTPLFYFLPEVILAAVILVAVTGLIDLGYTRQLWNDSKTEFSLLLITFLITLYFGMVPGIISGVVLAVLLLLYKAAYPHIARLGKVKGHHEFRNVKRFKDLEVWESILILRVDAPLTFINIQYFKDYIENAVEQGRGKLDTIILDAGPVSYLDATASLGLRELLVFLQEHKIQLLLCDLIGPVRDTLKRTGLAEVLDKEHIFLNISEAINYATMQQPGRYKEYALQANPGA